MENATRVEPRAGSRRVAAGLALGAALAASAWAEAAFGWFRPSYRVFTQLFYEAWPVQDAIRFPSQWPLARAHLAIVLGLAALGTVASPRLGRHGRRWWAVFCVGYAIRAVFWTMGGDLPLVPGDSCHYIEVARSVYRGEGPVKHYVESFFTFYEPIARGRGVLDDWATPLWAYVLAGAYRLTGVVPGESLEATFAVAKGTSFVLNLLCLPALYAFGRRRFGPGVGLAAMAALAVLPVHALYAGFALRESLVALTSILAVWWLTEAWAAEGAGAWAWAIAAGLAGGLAILARNTAMALVAAGGLYGLAAHRRKLGPMLAWGAVVAVVIAPWAWATWQEYGEPFYTYTKYFPYNFSWSVHHYDRGNTTPGEFYTAAALPQIARVKAKSLGIIALYSLMIVSFPLALGFVHRVAWPPRGARRDADRLMVAAWVVFVLATLANVADVTQVQQLGRYYLPVYVLMLPTAVAGLGDWLRASVRPRKWSRVAAATALLLWADPTWAYDAGWLAKSYQLHWPALRDAGLWIRAHPEEVPEDARIMTWFPWELRVTSDRTTILMPRALEAGEYELRRIEETANRYGVTHLLWGSFEPMPDQDPGRLGAYLEGMRRSLGLTESRRIYATPGAGRTPYPVTLYRLGRGPSR
jgi:4-amino-4-deoxy-L-arabinose transferase-like glycosyltransferase